MRSKENFIKSLSREELTIYYTYNFMYKSVDYYNKTKVKKEEINLELKIEEVIKNLIKFRDKYKEDGIDPENISIEIDYYDDYAICQLVVEKIETEEEFNERVDLEEQVIRNQIKNIDAKYEIALEDLKVLRKENEELKIVINTLTKFNV